MSVESRAFLNLLREQIRGAVIEGQLLGELFDSNSPWTEFMLGSGQSRITDNYGILGKIGRLLGYKVQAEYLRVDQIWYSETSSREEWSIEAFLEHENNVDRLPETVRKLLQLGPGLKVVISYPKRADFQKRADEIGSVVAQRFGTLPETRILLIFGFWESPSLYWQGFEIDGVGRVAPVGDAGTGTA